MGSNGEVSERQRRAIGQPGGDIEPLLTTCSSLQTLPTPPSSLESKRAESSEALTGSPDTQLQRILERRRRAIEQPGGDIEPFLASRSSQETLPASRSSLKSKSAERSDATTGSPESMALPRQIKFKLNLPLDELGMNSSRREVTPLAQASNSDCSSSCCRSFVPSLLVMDAQKKEVLPRRLFQGREDLEDLVAKHQERQVAAAVEVLQAGHPTFTTRVLAHAEEARQWLLSFQSFTDAVETLTDAAAQRAPQVVSDVAKSAAVWAIDELRASRVAVHAFARPEVFLLEAPASDCPASPREALDCLVTALQHGRPNATVRTVAKVERGRKKVIRLWNLAQQVGQDMLSSKLARSLALKMQHCEMIADVYEYKNLRMFREDHPVEGYSVNSS